MSREVVRWISVGALLLAGGCNARGGSSSSLPVGAPVINVTMRDYHFDYDPVVAGSQVVFRVHNAGRTPHDLVLLPLPDDLPPIRVQLQGSERRFIPRVANVPTLRPGETGTFAVRLAPRQRYAMLCFLVAPDGRSHASKGMADEFRPAGIPAQGAPR